MIGGVGILIGPRALKSLNSKEKIKAKMILATFNGNPCATIISCYTPTMLVKKLNSSPSTIRYPLLFVPSRNTTFSSLAET